jgi:hypothetical protein
MMDCTQNQNQQNAGVHSFINVMQRTPQLINDGEGCTSIAFIRLIVRKQLQATRESLEFNSKGKQ